MPSSSPARAVGVALGAAAGALAVAAGVSWLVRLHRRPSAFSHPMRRQWALQKQAFVLMVNVSFASEADKAGFIAAWQMLAEHVRAHEPGTLAFELLQSDSSGDVLVYERFVSKDYYVEVHRTSGPMQAFRDALQEAAIGHEVAGRSFLELNHGFML